MEASSQQALSAVTNDLVINKYKYKASGNEPPLNLMPCPLTLTTESPRSAIRCDDRSGAARCVRADVTTDVDSGSDGADVAPRPAVAGFILSRSATCDVNAQQPVRGHWERGHWEEEGGGRRSADRAVQAAGGWWQQLLIQVSIKASSFQ